MRYIIYTIIIAFTTIIYSEVCGQIPLSDESEINLPEIEAENLLGEPRMPLGTSFYNYRMWKKDWGRFSGISNNLTLIGLADKTNSDSPTIRYDVSTAYIPNNTEWHKKDEFNEKGIHFTIKNTPTYIRVNYPQDGSITYKDLSSNLKELVLTYTKESIEVSGVTPSSVNLVSNENELKLHINRSEFYSRSAILSVNNFGSRAEKESLYSDIKYNLDNGNLIEAFEQLNILEENYRIDDRYYKLYEEFESLRGISILNTNKENHIVSIKETMDYISELGSPNKAEAVNIDQFVLSLLNRIDKGKKYIHLLIDSDLSAKKSDALFRRIKMKILTMRPNVHVNRAPVSSANRKLFFNGQIINLSQSYRYDEDGIEYKPYLVALNGINHEVSLGIYLKSHFDKSKAQKLKDSFFKYLDKISKKGIILYKAMAKSKRKLKRLYKVDDNDYYTVIKSQLNYDLTKIYTYDGENDLNYE